ncbi:MAG TPA: T9SS type A sorting domain-containing protein [Bacteroidales bacterium]|nr:T9SS type A sorting domain-containing protein [Bacteroidales bacterium]HQP05061.1 T9SS type A sorting domain-containing protein [Bacteroidales bacterium]
MKKKLLILSLISLIYTTSQSQNLLFWGEFVDGLIVRSNIDGTEIDTLCTGQVGVCRVRTDDTQKKVYWAASYDNKIRRINYDGSELEDVINTANNINVVEINPHNGRLYFSENYQNTIKSCKTDGSDLQTVITNAGLVMGIGIDTVRELIFWADMAAHELHRANLDGSEDTVILETNLNVFDICLDIKYLYVYFTERTGEKVWRVSYTGTNLLEIHQGSNVIGAITINDECNQIYWVERENGFIVTSTTMGAERQELIFWENSQISGIDVGNFDFSNVEEDTFSLPDGVIYPNPAGDYINLNLNGIDADKIEIYDITGKLISNDNLSSEQTQFFIGNLKSGLYVLKVYDGNTNIATLKFNKQ